MIIVRVFLLTSLMAVSTQWSLAQLFPNDLPFPPQQNTPQSLSTAPTIRVTSRETVVDVTVTDDKGNPVHGLKHTDFTLKEDGKPQPIRSFEEFSSKPSQAPEKLPPNIHTNQQPPPASGAVNILLLDFLNLEPPSFEATGQAIANQRHVKQAAIEFLQEMPTGTRVSVLGDSWPGHLRVLQGVSSDPALLIAAVEAMQYDTHSKDLDFDPDQHNRMTLEVLDQVAVDLIGIKGKKNLIWFNPGIPLIADPAQRTAGLPDYSADSKKTFGLLTAAQVTVYPVDPVGLPVEFPSSPVTPSLQGTLSLPGHAAATLSLEWVAEETGGVAFYNNNDLKTEIAKAVEAGSDFYTLTYVPPGKEYDGKHHTIHLDVDKPGLHLTYRDEYYAEDPALMQPPVGLALTTTPPDTHAGDMKAAMSRSLPISSDLLFYVDVEPSTTPLKPTDPPVMGTLDPSLNGKPLTRYTFSYSISAGRLAYTKGPNATHNGSVELDLAAYDTDAKLVTGLSQTVNMSLNDKTVANKEPLSFTQQIDLPPGQLFVRIGVLDRTSNKVGTLEIPLKVEKKTETANPNATPPTQKPDAAINEPVQPSASEPPPTAANTSPAQKLNAANASPTSMPEAANGKPEEPPGLGEILQRLQENVDQYQAEVPSFFCDEHATSTIIPDPRHESTATDSTFRLKRVPDPHAEDRTILEESHEVKLVNGRPATGDTVGGPAFLRGAFSNGLALVSTNQQACMRYTLKPNRQNKPNDPITIQFASVPAHQRPDNCLMKEDVSGRVLIDPETMQIKHLEFTAPHHLINPGGRNSDGDETPSVDGEWDVTVEYAPVLLDGKSFWLPTKTHEHMWSGRVFAQWGYDATYSNYHKLEVTSRILPGEAPAP